MIALVALLAAQSIEWVAIPVDPPSTTPRQYVRIVTTQQGRPTLVAPYTATPVRTGTFAIVTGTPINLSGQSWCLHPTQEVRLASLAVEVAGLGAYTFNPLQPEIGQPSTIGACRSALNITGLNLAAAKVSALLWVWDQ